MVCGTSRHQLVAINKRRKGRNSELADLKAEAVSNHTLWATGTLHLYAAGVPDKLIMKRSGHLSTKGVHYINGLQFNRKRQFQVCCPAQANSLLMLWNQFLYISHRTVRTSFWHGSALEVKTPSDIPEIQMWSELKPLTGEQQDPAVGSELPPETMPPSDIGGTQVLLEVKPQSEANKPKEKFA